MKLHTQILFAIVLGIFVGFLLGPSASMFQVFGDLFIRLLRMMVIPLVFSSIVVGVCNLGSVKNLGHLGARTFSYYIVTTLVATFIGLLAVNIMQPGKGTDQNLLMSSAPVQVTQDSLALADIAMEIVPENIFVALTEDNVLGVIFFSLLFGCGLISLSGKGGRLTEVIENLNDLMLKLTNWIMLIAPIGVFSLMASIVGKTGLTAFKPLVLYMSTVLVGLVAHLGLVLLVIVFIWGKYSPAVFLKRMFPAIATAFSTNSSVVTLPVTMESLEKNMGVSKRVVSFVAPLGATINMDGTALYEVVAAVFIAQLYGVDLSFSQQLVICVASMLASIGAAGIPSAGLVTLVIVLKSVNLPLEGVGLLLAVDRVLDMCRTTINVLGDASGSLVIARLEGERFS
ncbi:MAG: dicarboxylate/amino acid:cation symporter [Actinobacteria bacterium]|nr:dicarboxylate/amino acid:cation symporter [Actinomycetota bacterium]